MIVVRILGGLGNQMFQYAAACALAHARAVPLKLDLQDLREETSHGGYVLDSTFGLRPQHATNTDLRAVLGMRRALRRLMIHRYGARFRSSRVIVEPHFTYWPALQDVPLPCYMVGYWQSPLYFQAAERQIRTAFSFPWPLSGEAEQIARLIASSSAVSLHVRRGDYVANPGMLKLHGVCPPDYYQRAIAYVAERVEQPTFFVFSDDIEWTMANLNVPFQTHYVGARHRSTAREDLRLMSLCRHHIVANSTFSWWGAWLNPDPHKIVCAPRRWFAGDAAADVSTLFPSGWALL